MLQFIKGHGITSYSELVELKPEFKDALYLDVDANRLYLNSSPVDVRINVINEVGDDFIPKTSYQFTNADGNTAVINETVIPSVEDYKTTLHDMESGEDNVYHNGLFSVTDKFVLDMMAKLIGITLKYTYYANVHHIEERKNNDFETTRDVIVYKNEYDEWVYDYESFQYTIFRKEGEEYVVDSTATQPAGSEPVEESLVRVQSVEAIRRGDVPVFFDGGELDDEKQTLLKHGGIPAGTTVGDLEKKTISEVLSQILFEDAKPEKTSDTKVVIKLTETYAPEVYVEVGTKYPTKDDFEVVFTSETWNLVIDGSIIGDAQEITEMGEVKIYIKDEQHPWGGGHGTAPDNIYDLDDPEYLEYYNDYVVADGDKSEYYAKVKYTVVANPKDSDGHESYINADGEEVLYREVIDGVIPVGEEGEITSENIIHLDGTDATDGEFDAEFNVIAGWKIASNAAVVTDEDIWSTRNDEPDGEFAGNDAVEISDYFAKDEITLYAKWTSDVTPEDKFFIYLPVGYEISSIGFAHDMIPSNYESTATAYLMTAEEDDYKNISNSLGVVGKYVVYEISKAAGITTVKFTVKKV